MERAETKRFNLQVSRSARTLRSKPCSQFYHASARSPNYPVERALFVVSESELKLRFTSRTACRGGSGGASIKKTTERVWVTEPKPSHHIASPKTHHSYVSNKQAIPQNITQKNHKNMTGKEKRSSVIYARFPAVSRGKYDVLE